MKRLFLIAVLAFGSLLPGCGLLPLPTPPAAVPTFYLPTDLPTGTPTPLPTATVTPTPTATAAPLLPDSAGEIYVTLAERPKDAKFTLTLARFPAGCVDCPEPVEVPGLVSSTGDPQPLAWSPDGQVGALRLPANDGQPDAVWFYTPDSKNWEMVAEFEHILSPLYWSPDGQLLALYATQGGKTDFYTLSADGSQVSNVSKGVLTGYKQVLPAGWLNGELVFSALTTRGLKAHAVGVKYPRVHILSNIIVLSGSEENPLPLLPSPDNKWIAYTEITPRVGQTLGLLRVKDTEVSHPLLSSKDARIGGYAWSADGGWLAVWMRLGDTSEVDLVRPDGSQLHPVYNTLRGIRNVIFDPGGSEWMLVETFGRPEDPQPGGELALVHATSGVSVVMRAPVGEVSWEGASWRPARP